MYKYILVPHTDLCAFFWIKMTHSYLVERDLTLSCVVKNIQFVCSVMYIVIIYCIETGFRYYFHS